MEQAAFVQPSYSPRHTEAHASTGVSVERPSRDSEPIGVHCVPTKVTGESNQTAKLPPQCTDGEVAAVGEQFKGFP